jgi:hypothetical protein
LPLVTVIKANFGKKKSSNVGKSITIAWFLRVCNFNIAELVNYFQQYFQAWQRPQNACIKSEDGSSEGHNKQLMPDLIFDSEGEGISFSVTSANVYLTTWHHSL